MFPKPEFTCLFIASAFTLAATGAAAHVSIDSAETKGGSFKAVFNVPHGCDGSPTTAVSITIPEGVIGVKPVPKPGWSLATEKGPYAKTYDYFHGMKFSEGVKSVTWSGGKLLNEHLDEFVIGLFVTDAFSPGATIYFPVEQTCETGAIAWNEVPAAGQNAHELKRPAPALRVAAKVAEASPSTIKAGSLTIEAPWLRATPGGASVGAGYLKITNSGAEADTLLGASFPFAGRTEVHEMTMDGEVMKMRALPDGLAIRPGETVTLAPGGVHLMLLDLKSAISPGAPIKGELKFAKAGKVEVNFAVTPIGASSPAAAVDHSQH
ncbi:MAG: DUF1775 domain-containing protein [Hyphomicrobium sp.]